MIELKLLTWEQVLEIPNHNYLLYLVRNVGTNLWWTNPGYSTDIRNADSKTFHYINGIPIKSRVRFLNVTHIFRYNYHLIEVIESTPLLIKPMEETNTQEIPKRDFVALDFLFYMAIKHNIQAFHTHSYPALAAYLGTELAEHHNPQLIFPLLLVDAFNEERVNIHNTKVNDVKQFTFSGGWIKEYEDFRNNNPPPTWERGITNKVLIDGKVKYIPMFDMTGQFYDSRAQLVNAFGAKFAENNYADKAFVFKTDRSYHVFLDVCLDERGWRDLVIDSGLYLGYRESFHPDLRWISHTLQETFTAIRISNHTKATIPHIVYAPPDFYEFFKTRKIKTE